MSFISAKLTWKTDVEECDGASLFPTKGVHGQVSMLKAPVENFHLHFGVAEAAPWELCVNSKEVLAGGITSKECPGENNKSY